MNKNKTGLLNLTKKTIAVITASLSSLLGSNAISQEQRSDSKTSDKDAEQNRIKLLRPQLVLKLNRGGFDGYLLAMHTSHRSHSSHSSHYSSSSSGHSSHSSHSSHYSSAPSYTPSNTVPYTAPSQSSSSSSKSSSTAPKPSSTPHTPTIKKEAPITTQPTTQRRVLKKGCEGKDVDELQLMLVKLDFKVYVTGYFGETTETAIKKFQTAHHFIADGIVTPLLFDFIKNQ